MKFLTWFGATAGKKRMSISPFEVRSSATRSWSLLIGFSSSPAFSVLRRGILADRGGVSGSIRPIGPIRRIRPIHANQRNRRAGASVRRHAGDRVSGLGGEVDIAVGGIELQP